MLVTADQLFAQIRPILAIVGSIVIVIALVKFAGFNVPVHAAWWELGLAGFLAKNV